MKTKCSPASVSASVSASPAEVSRPWLCAALLAPLCAITGCVSLKTEHKVEPIHVTMDVNVRLERELESAFSDLDAQAREIAATHNGGESE